MVPGSLLPASAVPQRADAADLGGATARRGVAGPSGCSADTQVSPQSWREEAASAAAPHPSPRPRAPSRGAAARLARRGRSGAGTPRAAPAGFRSPRGLRARRERFCSARRPGHSAPYCRPRPPASAPPAFPPSPGRGRGSPGEPESRGPVPAARQAGKLGSSAPAVRTSERPRRALQGDAALRAPGPQRGAAGPAGGGGGLAPSPRPRT